jgi:hypothetical protein
VLCALFGLYPIIVGMCALAAFLLFIFNLAYYRWLGRPAAEFRRNPLGG